MGKHDKEFYGAEGKGEPGHPVKVKNEDIAVLLEKCGGFVSKVAKTTGMTVTAVQTRIRRSEMLQRKQREIRATVVDIAEASLIAAAQRGEPWAVQFILKCQGKDRGWVESQRIEMEHSVAPPPPVVLGTFPIEDAHGGGAAIDAETADFK